MTWAYTHTHNIYAQASDGLVWALLALSCIYIHIYTQVPNDLVLALSALSSDEVQQLARMGGVEVATLEAMAEQGSPDLAALLDLGGGVLPPL